MTYDIQLRSYSPTIAFAARELAKYLRLISREPLVCNVRMSPSSDNADIALGLFDDFESKEPEIGPDDDAIRVAIANGKGTIAGSNPRSVLMAVYRLLHHAGCRWVRPGAEGEFLPRIDLQELSAEIRHTASLRHRAICIEGAVSLENVLDIIDWAPKVGFSGYFMQFPDGYAFFDRWYSHAGHPGGDPEPFSREKARAFTMRVEEEIRRRGMDYHAVGHGWHARAMGIDVSHWNPVHPAAPADVSHMWAEVDGKRGLRWDRPMITSLCFSQDEVRQRMVDVVVDYALDHPEVDYLHVWLDDGANNKCACEECRKVRPADLYVRMLHQMDAALTGAGSDMHLVFISYTDLRWPPAKDAEPLDPDRFSLVYANHRASFSEPLDHAYADPPELPPFVHNHSNPKQDAGFFSAVLKRWQAFFGGDAMLFEYYSGGFDHVPLSQTVHDDVRRLKGMGLNGVLNCQRQRAFFPTGLTDYVLGQTLWDTSTELDATIEEYHRAAFGEDGALAKEFIKLTVEESEKAVARSGGRLTVKPGASAHLDKLENLICEFRKVCERNLHGDDPCHSRSWFYMLWYMRITEKLLALYRTIVTGDRDAALGEWKELKSYLFENEPNYQAVFDVWSFCRTYDRMVIDGFCSSAPEDVL